MMSSLPCSSYYTQKFVKIKDARLGKHLHTLSLYCLFLFLSLSLFKDGVISFYSSSSFATLSFTTLFINVSTFLSLLHLEMSELLFFAHWLILLQMQQLIFLNLKVQVYCLIAYNTPDLIHFLMVMIPDYIFFSFYFNFYFPFIYYVI